MYAHGSALPAPAFKLVLIFSVVVAFCAGRNGELFIVVFILSPFVFGALLIPTIKKAQKEVEFNHQ